MKRKNLFFKTLFLITSLFACSCSTNNISSEQLGKDSSDTQPEGKDSSDTQPVDDKLYQIYESYKQSGGAYSFEEWLVVIRYDSGKGVEVYTGTETPTNSIGNNLDCFINTNSWYYYNKNNNEWMLRGCLIYSQASTDSQFLSYHPLDNGTLAVEGGTANLLSTIIIPSSYNGYKVTKILENGFKNFSNLQKIIVADSVENIGDYAFDGCSNLSSVFLGDNISNIGYSAFYNCTSDIIWSDHTSIENIGNYSFYGFKGEVFSIPDSVKTIGEESFYQCNNLNTITIGKNVKTIKQNAFRGCSNLINVNSNGTLDDWFNIEFATSFSNPSYYSTNVCFVDGKNLSGEISLPNNITSLNSYSLINCSGLKKIIIPSNVNKIGTSALQTCTSLESVSIPTTLDSIGDYAFHGCTSLNKVLFDGQLSDWLKISFSNQYSNPTFYSHDVSFKNGTNLSGSITIPSDIESIKAYAFCNCTNMSEVNFGPNLKRIGMYSFIGCTGLESISVPQNVEYISLGAFKSCSNLQSVVLPFVGEKAEKSQYSEKDYDAFGYIFDKQVPKSIKEVTILGGKMKDNAFANCTSITDFYIGKDVERFGLNVFSGCSNLSVFHFLGNLEEWLENPRIAASNAYFDYTIQLEDYSELSGNIIVPNSITELKEYSFANCSGIESVVLPEGLKSIGDFAFANCTNLSSVVIPSSVEEIGKYAFSGCSSLISIVLPDGLTVLNESLFSGCSNLVSVNIPSSVSIIESYVFRNCSSLVNLKLPNNIKYIYNDAFKNASNLSFNEYNNAYYLGTDSNSYYALIKAKNTNISSCTVHENARIIAGSAFSGCSQLGNFVIPDYIEYVGRWVFSGCYSLTASVYCGEKYLSSNTNPNYVIIQSVNTDHEKNLEIKQGTEVIPSFGLSRVNYSIESLIIPSSIKIIGLNAFYGNNKLNNVIYAGTIDMWNDLNYNDDYYFKNGSGNVVECVDGNYVY